MAEHSYCPRLFYYMEVEGIHLPSADTEQGIHIHRHADEPSNESVLRAAHDGEAPKVVRSLVLTSTTLGLTATLDLAEVDGKVAVPIEYRKGRPYHRVADNDEEADTVEPWPTDRVQVGLQSILLEEAGYSVPRAVLYYAAEKRRVTVAFDAGLKAEAL
ncbi:MAG: Dna2/Cas4 domain-containing protein, partial [Planctomycetia bacterium]|nr:Dna2/Cas4 domain-containing protein [Planctomycetia bacterium]